MKQPKTNEYRTGGSDALDYHAHIKEIKRLFPNKKKSDYENYSSIDAIDRLLIAEATSEALREHFVDRQPPGYKHKEAGRPLFLPTADENNAMELIADYILADDHAQGLKVSRSPRPIPEDDEVYPPLGEGAREYIERLVVGVPVSIGEKRKIKTCEICESTFIDQSRAFNARVCGASCRTIKEARRKRAEYNRAEHDLEDDARLKRDRERQQHEYPFYSPVELEEFKRRGEISVGGDVELSRRSVRRGETYRTIEGNATVDAENSWRVHGKRKPMFVGRDEFSENPFVYHPRGRNEPEPKSYDHLAGEVKEYRLSDVELRELGETLEKQWRPRELRISGDIPRRKKPIGGKSLV